VSVRYYRALLNQQERIEAFRRAISGVVRRGDKVLDVGTGLGTFAFFAADAGADKVWGVEGSPIVHVASVIGRLNGYEERVEFLRASLPNVSLPERCDVFIFEDFPSRLVDTSTFSLLRHLHLTYLSDGVRSVPLRAVMSMAPVRSPAARARALDLAAGESAFGIDWSPSREYVANAPVAIGMTRDEIVAAPANVGEFRFDGPPDAGGLGGTAEWRVETPGTIDGLAYWFDLELAPGEWLSNAPGAAPGSWGHLFLPAEPALHADAGELVRATVRPGSAEDGAPTWLGWTVEVGSQVARGNEFAAHPASLDDLAGVSADAVPELDSETRLVLSLTDGSRSIRQIAKVLRDGRSELTQAEAERVVIAILRGRTVAARHHEHALAKE
jgi:SAM-dependent methyltransferase